MGETRYPQRKDDCQMFFQMSISDSLLSTKTISRAILLKTHEFNCFSLKNNNKEIISAHPFRPFAHHVYYVPWFSIDLFNPKAKINMGVQGEKMHLRKSLSIVIMRNWVHRLNIHELVMFLESIVSPDKYLKCFMQEAHQYDTWCFCMKHFLSAFKNNSKQATHLNCFFIRDLFIGLAKIFKKKKKKNTFHHKHQLFGSSSTLWCLGAFPQPKALQISKLYVVINFINSKKIT